MKHSALVGCVLLGFAVSACAASASADVDIDASVATAGNAAAPGKFHDLSVHSVLVRTPGVAMATPLPECGTTAGAVVVEGAGAGATAQARACRETPHGW